MRNMQSEINRRELCLERDKEFLELYRPTLDALLQKGMTESKARRAAAEFTVANGHPHYHVDHASARPSTTCWSTAAPHASSSPRSLP